MENQHYTIQEETLKKEQLKSNIGQWKTDIGRWKTNIGQR